MEIVIFPGSFHPFHRGHLKTYTYLREKFPNADVYVASSASTKERPFPFYDKKNLAVAAGIPADRFIEVKSPYQATEITKKFNPLEDVVIFAMSEKDKGRLNFKKKDGSPGYFQPYEDSEDLKPFGEHGYVVTTPIVKFQLAGETILSASQIRDMYKSGSADKKMEIIKEMYPKGDPEEIKKIFDGALNENMGASYRLLQKLQEQSKPIMEQGTYSSYKLTQKSADRLYNWMESVGIVDPVPKEDLHITVTYSEVPVDIVASKEMIVLDASDFVFDMLGEDKGAFVISVRSKELERVFNAAIDSGATNKWPKYHPHITLSYNASANEEIVSELTPPTFDIILSHEEVETIAETIEQKGNKWVLISKKGKVLFTADTKEEVEEREKEINYFKHRHSVNEAVTLTRTVRQDQQKLMKLDTLLRYGLVQKSMYGRARRAMLDRKTATRVTHLRELLIDILGNLLDIILEDPVTYHRILRDLLVKGPLVVGEEKMIDEAIVDGIPGHDDPEDAVSPGMFPVPTPISDNASEGISMRKEFSRGGQPSAVEAAKKLRDDGEVDKEFVKKLKRVRLRYQPTIKPGWDDPEKPSNDYITWLMLGGDAASSWIKKILSEDE